MKTAEENFDFTEWEDEGMSQNPEQDSYSASLHSVTSLSGMFRNWFLDYASYVILERAVPHLLDGLKPVQRRILYSMRRMEDGRYHKVANIIGHTMQFHPHGDVSIGDALVQLGQKELLIDTQGNWGNILTGDGAAAPRYIEARLSKFALEVLFNPKTTEWKLSYDGRNKEPVTLPVKFPLLLALGTEGIAVGLASKILPHNFNELIDAAIDYLMGKDFVIYPDFPTGGLIDVSKYNDGQRGGMVRIRAKIEKLDKKTLVIREIPYGKTTSALIDSIIKASENGKIKIRRIDDNTAANVEIVIHLMPGVSPDQTIDALYALTDCEYAISPNSCVIFDNKPSFMGVSEMLRRSVDHTVELLKAELVIRKDELLEELHMMALEKIFIEKKIYRNIENCETWESVLETIEKGLAPYKRNLLREITQDDIIRLTEIKIKRISKYDSAKAGEQIKKIESELDEVKNNLNNIIPYTVNYFRQIKKKYGKGRERKTEIRNFDTIEAAKVVADNARLYANFREGFIGTSLKKDEFVCECSDIDDIIVIRRNGTYLVTKVAEKVFVGPDIIHAAVFHRNDYRTIYNIMYQDGKDGKLLAKRCAITGITRDREYNLTRGKPGTKIMYLSANRNGEAEVVKVFHRPRPRLKKAVIEYDFSKLDIKGKNAIGNIVTRLPVQKVVLKEKGVSTLGGRKIWFDDTVLRLNADGRGKLLGEFSGEDKILVITRSGRFRTTDFDLSNHFEDDLLLIEKFRPETVYSAIYWDADLKYYYVKRFMVEETEKPLSFIGDNPESKLVSLTEVQYPRFEVKFGGKHKGRKNEIVEVAKFIGVKSYKARGKRLTSYVVENIQELEPVIKKEGQLPQQPGEDKEVEKTIIKDTYSDPAQMKLEL